MFELSKDTLSKSPIISKVFSKGILEFFLHYRIFDLGITLLLMLLLNYCSTEKKHNYKKALI